jgi:hypothetical protein
MVLLAAFAVTRSCGSRDQKVSENQAITLATTQAGFTPCSETGCVLVRALSQGIPSRLYWLVGLAQDLDANGEPTHVKNFLVDMETGEVTQH